MMTAAQPGLISALMPTPSQDVVLYKMTEAEAADKDQRRRIVNSEFTIFYGYDVDAYLPPLPPKERVKTNAAPVWSCENPAVRQLACLRRRGPRNVFPGQVAVRKQVLLTPELRRPHTAVETSVKSILNTRYSRRPQTSDGKIESYTFRLSQPPKHEPELIKPKKVKVLDHDRDVDTLSIASSVPGRFRQPRFIKPGPKKKYSRRRRTACHLLLANQRKDAIARVLKGDLQDLPEVIPTKVKIYLSATTQDFMEERKVLEKTALPELREYCAQQGLEFQLVDFPAKEDDRVNIAQQLEELDSCREESFGPYFVTLIGDYTGPPVLPAQLPEEDFDLLSYVADHHNMKNAELMSKFYLEDNNAEPMVYLLQMDEVRGAQFEDFCELFSNILAVAETTQRITTSTRQYYELKSTVEHEVKHGVFGFKDTATIGCLAFVRRFKNFNNFNSNAFTYGNWNEEDEEDEKLQERRDNLKERLRYNLFDESNMRCYSLTWNGNGVEGPGHQSSSPVAEEHQGYLSQFHYDFVSSVKRLINVNKERWYTKHPLEPVFNEVIQHAHVTKSHTSVFSGREDMLKDIHSYLKDEGQHKPLILYGETGCGKSALASSLATHGKKCLGKDTYTVIRHCGISDKSSNLCELLVYLCLQICAIYNMEPPRVLDRSSVNKMAQHFELLIELVSRHHVRKGPLLIILDDIDKLDEVDRSETLFWLPRECPDSVKLIVTLNAQSQALLEKLQHRMSTTSNFIYIDDPSSKDILTMLINTIKYAGRKLEQDQISALANISRGSSHPAFVATMCRIAKSWCSWTFVDYELLPVGVEDAMYKLIFSLQHGFGDLMTERVLCYLTMLPGGMSEMDLRDAISCDMDVLESLVQNCHDDEYSRFFMMNRLYHLITRILKELKPLMRDIHKNGKTLLCWWHEEFRQVLATHFFEGNDGFMSTTDKIELYQQSLISVLQQEKPPVRELGQEDTIEIVCPNLPQLLLPCSLFKLRTIPVLMDKSSKLGVSSQTIKDVCLCNFQWLLTKLQGVRPKEVLRDYELVDDRDDEVDLLKEFLRLAKRGLNLEPLTLASQLLGCLPCLKARDFPLVNKMLEDGLKFLEDTMHTMLVPLYPVFPNPVDVCRMKIWGYVDILTFDESGRLAVTKNDNGYIEIWDIESYEVAFELGAKYNKTHPNVHCSNERIFYIEEGFTAKVWEIESGILLYNVNLGKLLGVSISSIFLFCHDEGYKTVGIHTSDDDFNQTITVVDMTKGTMLNQITNFDVKDEFFRNSAIFTFDRKWLVFVNARSQLMDDGKTTDYVKMHMLSLQSGKVEREIKCGEKKFHQLLPRTDGKCIIAWTDCSFDIYDTELGTHSEHLAAPDSRLQLHHCFLSADGCLLALSSTTTKPTDSSMQYYALWFWINENQPPVNLVSQTFTQESEVPTQCVIIEEIHIAIMATPETAVMSVWDLPNSECISTFQAHTEFIERLVTTNDPFRFYSCSSGEEVVKLWDIHDIVKQTKDVKKIDQRRIINSDSQVQRSTGRGSAVESGILKRPGSRAKGSTTGQKSVRFASEDFVEGEETVESIDNVEFVPLPSSENDTELVDDPDNTIGGRNAIMVKTQLKMCEGVTCVDFSKESIILVSGSEFGMPVVWNCNNGDVIQVMQPHSSTDVSVPWVGLAVQESLIVGLCESQDTKKSYPSIYRYQVWNRETGDPVIEEVEYFASACALMHDKERAVLSCFDEDMIGKEIHFKVLQVQSSTIIHAIKFETTAIPTEMTIADDNIHAITNDVPVDNGRNRNTMIFKVGKDQDEDEAEAADKDPPVAMSYIYQEGNKYKEYRSVMYVPISNGMAISSGLNGDMQMWDIATSEYEGNLYHDPTVKETRDPNLHNYGGKRACHLAMSENGCYLICGLNDGSAVLWDLDNDALCYTYKGHTLEVCQVAISWDNQLVLTSSRDLSLCVWQFATPERALARLYIHSVPTLLKISLDKRTVVAVGTRKNEPAKMMIFNLRNTFTD